MPQKNDNSLILKESLIFGTKCCKMRLFDEFLNTVIETGKCPITNFFFTDFDCLDAFQTRGEKSGIFLCKRNQIVVLYQTEIGLETSHIRSLKS